MNPRGDITWIIFWNRYCRGILGGLCIFVLIAWLVSCFVFALVWAVDSTATSEIKGIQTALIHTASPAERQYVAAAFLRSSSEIAYDESTIDFLRKVLTTGEIPPITDDHVAWSDFLSFWWDLTPPILYGALLSIMLNLVMESVNRRERILDLPWRKPWVWLFILLTIVPGILVYPISLVNVIKDRRARQALGQQSSVTIATPDTPATIRAKYDFAHDIETARQAYRRLRIGDRRAELEEKLEAVKKQIARLIERGQQLAGQIQQSQRERGEAQAKQTEIEHQLRELHDQPPEALRVNYEFEQLCQLPGVVGLHVNERGEIVVLVRATLHYNNTTYFQGDWQVNFGEELHVTCLQSGAKPGWKYGKHPDYRDSGGFCFGRQAETIRLHAQRRAYLEAMALIVNCLNSATSEDEPLIPHVFERV